MRSISDLFSDHSGKCSDKWESYLEVYEAELLSFRCRETPISLLEIGVQDGGSLEIWQKAMPPGSSIVGIDIDPRVSLLPYQAGVEVFVADASNPAVLTALLQGKNFDIIIDDASHKSFDIITTFEKLFPALKYGGLYIIEDLACSYQPSFGGGLRRPGAAIEWLKCLVDILHVESWDGITLNEQDLHFRNHYSRLVQRVTFYESIAVVAKRLMPKLQPTRRVFTGATASHSPHIQLVANDFPLMPDQFRLTEAFARQVILEIARQRDSGLALASRVEPGLLSDQETSSDATGRPDLEIDANLEPASTTSDPKALLGEKPEIASYLDPVFTLDQMIQHVEMQSDVFKPSLFWQYFKDKNVTQLEQGGLKNFKRTINQNYFNWILSGPEDNQFQALVRLCSDNSAGVPANVIIEDYDNLEGFFDKNPLSDPDGRDLYAVFLGMLWQYTRSTNPNGLTDVLEEPLLGNPLRCYLSGKLISQDLANSIRERNVILGSLEADFALGRSVSIVELGAGYGRLGYVLLSSARCRYTVVDIPPALHVSQWYLTSLFPTKKVFRFSPWTDVSVALPELMGADICFLTPDQFAKLPDSFFDVAVAISNLAEMTRKQNAMYVDLLGTKTAEYIYIKQWKSQRNDFDDVDFVKDDFDIAGPWIRVIDRDDAVQDLFFETLWRRVK